MRRWNKIREKILIWLKKVATQLTESENLTGSLLIHFYNVFEHESGQVEVISTLLTSIILQALREHGKGNIANR